MTVRRLIPALAVTALFSFMSPIVPARAAPTRNSTNPTTMATASFHVVANPPQ